MAVSFNEIPSGIRVPLFYAEVDNSAAYTPTDTSQALLIGQMTSEGTAEVGKPVTVSTAGMAKTLFGRGSVLARMVSAYRTVDGFGQLRCIPLADGKGASPASGTVSFTGSATGAGTLSLYIGATRIQVGIPEGTDAGKAAQALADAIAVEKDLPVTATASTGGGTSSEGGTTTPVTGEVTLQAKTPGTLGNGILLALNLRGAINGEETPSGLGVKITAMAGGAADPDVKAAITAMGDESYDFIGVPYCDAAVLDLFQTEMKGRWSYLRQIYGHVYTAKRADLQTLQTFGQARNDPHMTVVGVEPAMPSVLEELLAAYVARTAVFISADPARPTQTGVLTGMMASPSDSRFIMTERQTLLTSGIATLTSDSGGQVLIERAITTYQRNSFGDKDGSYLDSEILHSLAYILRRLRSVITTKYARHKLADDGTRYGPGQAIVTPSVIRGELVAVYRQLELAGIVENSKLFKENLIVERNADDPNRLDVLFPPDLVNQLRVFAVLNQFRLQYAEE